MTQRERWRDELVAILKELGGKASLAKIYDSVEKRNRMDLSSPSWDSRVRDTLEVYSSDSAIFNRTEDIFYSVAGIRRGIWGLRSYINPTAKPSDFDSTPESTRVHQEIYRILRDSELSRLIKAMYNNECQLCGDFIDLPDGSRYSEGHHVRPLGRPHNGPDIKANILCLCPNCHVKLDYGVIRIDQNKLTIHKSHEIDFEFVAYHNLNIFKAGQTA